MATADKRVAIRNTTTGQVGHAIEGHIPEGWVRADTPKPAPKPAKA